MSTNDQSVGGNPAPGEILRDYSIRLDSLEDKLAARILGEDKLAEIEVLSEANSAISGILDDNDREMLELFDNIHGRPEREWPGEVTWHHKRALEHIASEAIAPIRGLEDMVPSLGDFKQSVVFLGWLSLNDDDTDTSIVEFMPTTMYEAIEVRTCSESGYNFNMLNRLKRAIFGEAHDGPPLEPEDRRSIEDSPYSTTDLFLYLSSWEAHYQTMLTMPLDSLIAQVTKKRQELEGFED